jgi:hypothetical protein
MSRNADNRRRAFADVVSIDAWHAAFGAKRPRVDLHADVVFGTARVGGEVESPVRFRLSVKRAEVVVIIPDSEPVSVDPKSVARETPEAQGRLTEIVEQKAHARAKGRIATSISPKALLASASVEAAAQGSISSNKKLEMSAAVRFNVCDELKDKRGLLSVVDQT